MNANVPGRRQHIQIRSNPGIRTARRRVNYVFHDLGIVARLCAVEHDVAANLPICVIVHHGNTEVRKLRYLRCLLPYFRDPAILRQQRGQEVAINNVAIRPNLGKAQLFCYRPDIFE